MYTKEIEIYCKNNGKTIQTAAGTTLIELQQLLKVKEDEAIIAALVNNKLRALDSPLFRSKTIEFIKENSASGKRIYSRSLIFILYKALQEIYPTSVLRVELPISAGYYCEITDKDNNKIEQIELQEIKQRMAQIIESDLKFKAHYKSTKEIIKFFEEEGRNDIVALLQFEKQYYTQYYTLDGLPDFYTRLLVPSTGYLSVFELSAYFDGFLLRIPEPGRDHKAYLKRKEKHIYKAFKDHIDHCRLFGINDIADLNNKSEEELSQLIKITEALHEKRISQIADHIASKENLRLVLIAGPSSSGKTTFTKRLGIQLAASGLIPIELSMDNYFVNRVDTPLDKDGEHDFESLYAVDLKFFKEQMVQLTAGKEIETPTYNFETGEREFRGNKMQIKENQILIIEGIHALNPQLSDYIEEELIYKVYVSAITTLSLNDHNFIPTADTRLLRRIIRDHKYRSHAGEKTILRWPSVRRGEHKWISPYKMNADIMFNSALLFELSALKKQAEPILSDVREGSDAYPTAQRLLTMLKYFTEIPSTSIPMNSLLREFLGGSGFRY